MKIRKNDPCPCGSGKKYKNCCINKGSSPDKAPAEIVSIRSKDHYVSAGEVKDYGEPRFDEDFFEKNFEENSIHRILYGFMKHPEIELLALELIEEEYSGGKLEEKRIKKAKSIEDLIKIMKKGPDLLNHHLLVNRILEYEDEAIPIILKELEDPKSDLFAELAVKIIYESQVDCSEELVELIKKPVSNAYTLSLLCMLAGMIDIEEAVKPLWNCFHFFKERYPQETYSQGPLFGLFEIYFVDEEDELDDEDFDEEDLGRNDHLIPNEIKLKLDEDSLREIQTLIIEAEMGKAAKLFREKTGASSKESKEAVEAIEEALFTSEDDEDFDEEDFEEWSEEYEKEVEEQKKRVWAVLGKEDVKVSKTALTKYMNYLKQNLKTPCCLTPMQEFGWEEFYVIDMGNQREYELLKKENPSFTDIFDLISFEEKIDEMAGIMVNVERDTDKKRFVLPLADLEEVDIESKNYELIDDYSFWFVNY